MVKIVTILLAMVMMAGSVFGADNKGSQVTENETKALNALLLFHSVELTYQAREGKGSFADIETMFKLAYIDGELSNATGCPAMVEAIYNNRCAGDGAALHGYKFKVFVQSAEGGKPARFTVFAYPSVASGDGKTGERCFSIDDTGEIRIFAATAQPRASF
ncbi:MAG: hypothetical protein JNN15_10385 [Blastocatellia bacterium]|nr:hypothetical protein [Blastocatellia bacterium]